MYLVSYKSLITLSIFRMAVVACTVIATATLTASFAAAQQMMTARNSPRYAMPTFVEAISSNTIGGLRSEDETANTLKGAYLVGFGLWLDRACDFLPASTRDHLYPMVETASDLSGRNRLAASLLAAVRLGAEDAKIYLGENGCTTREALRAMRSLAGYLH